jgi:hypothetical protein
MRRLLPAFLILFIAPALHAEQVLPPATGFASLKLPRGARAAALAGAYSTLADDALSMQYNPAGLSGLREAQLSLSHMAWLDDVQDESLSLGIPLFGLGAWGLGLNYLHSGDQGRDGFGSPTGDFSLFDFSAQAAFSVLLGADGAVGLEYKILRQTYAGKFDMGSCFDAGFQYKGFFSRRLGLSIVSQSMGTNVALGSAYAPLPWTLKAGMSLKATDGLSLACDYDYQPNEFSGKVRLGAEYVSDLGDERDLSFRAGWLFGPENAAGALSGLSVGFGAHWQAWRVDYAFVPKGDLGNSHLASLSVGFGQR